MKGCAQLFFEDGAQIRRWLDEHCPLMKGTSVQAFGDGGGPRRWNHFQVTDFRRYLDATRYCGDVSGPGFIIHYHVPFPILEFEFANPARCRDLGPQFVRWFEERGLRYGYACLYKEFFDRNLFKYYLPDRRRPNTTVLGTDINRYVPGLYWLNYFSHKYAEARGIDVERVAEQIDGIASRTDCGWLLTAFKDPARWREKADKLKEFLAHDPRFFSLTRVPQPPRLTLKDCFRFTTELHRLYP